VPIAIPFSADKAPIGSRSARLELTAGACQLRRIVMVRRNHRAILSNPHWAAPFGTFFSFQATRMFTIVGVADGVLGPFCPRAGRSRWLVPAMQTPQEGFSMHSQAAPTIAHQLRALLVAPDEDERQMLELALSIRGEIVTACEDAAAARNAMTLRSHGIIVLRRHLPDTDALALIREIREQPGGSQPYIVLLAADPDAADQAMAIAAGADDYLPWPTNLDVLRERFDLAEDIARGRAEVRVQAMNAPTGTRLLALRADGTITWASPAAESLFGFPAEAMDGVNAFSFFHNEDAPALLGLLTSVLSGQQSAQTVEVRVRRDGGSWRTALLGAVNELDNPDVRGIVLVQHQMGDQAGLIGQVTRAALYDRATDLPNQALFIDRLQHALARAARHDWPVIVLTLDFNDFQTVSGTQHTASEGLQLAIAQRLLSCLRTSDTAARLGPDELGVVLEEVTDADNVAVVANRILRTMEMPFYDEGDEVELSPAVGIAISSIDRYRATDLLRDANLARAWARVQGSGRFVIYDEAMAVPADLQPQPDLSTAPAAQPAPAPGLDDQISTLQSRINALEETLRRLGGETS
jgi:diguanylate cyclase (GGDEF)-like protein/PAS domain S-box-containing protein